ncbi:MAG: class II aldolase/adducin family protein, partial [Spirochaetaceae bacterium]|nr:class II aldolase/adducin family protein [Spirochaetaceae bacterium]
MDKILNDLIAVSREYGSDPKWVVAGGGNTSLKVDDVLYVKASGFPLATIDESGFARMDRSKLAAIWETDYPAGEDTAAVAKRESLVLADMMAACLPEEEKRPSVEALLHDLLPWPLIVHLHPTLVNGLTCGIKGEEIAGEL